MAARPRCVCGTASGTGALIKGRFELLLVAGAALLLGAIAYLNATQGPPPSVPSTYDTGPNGYRALYEVLRAAGLPVTRFEREPGLLDAKTGTFVLTAYENDPSGKPLDEHDAKTLRAFVENGGRLVAIDADFAGKADVTPDAGVTRAATANVAQPGARNAYTAGVARVTGPITAVFPFRGTRGTPLLVNSRGIVALSYRVGRGEVVAIAAPSLFSNRALRDADNLRFAYNVVGGHGAAAFDEFAHGYDDNPSFWAALPAPVHAAVWIVLAVAVLGLIGANLPFAPPYLPQSDGERDSSSYITALAELMRRSRHRQPDDDVLYYAQIAYRDRKEPA